jgi:hypothetical protein
MESSDAALRERLPDPKERPPDEELHRGPSLVAVAAVHAALFVASLVVSRAMAGASFPSPFGPRGPSDAYFAEHPTAVQALAFFQLGAAVPLGIFAATAASRLQFLGARVAGVHIGLFGGVAASIFEASSACAQWALSQPGVSDVPAVTRALHILSFAIGGPACVIAFGLLIAGVSLVAGLQAFVPRWLMISGLVIAAVAELSVLAFVAPGAAYLLPIARFPGLAWMICMGALLPKTRAPKALRDLAARPMS